MSKSPETKNEPTVTPAPTPPIPNVSTEEIRAHRERVKLIAEYEDKQEALAHHQARAEKWEKWKHLSEDAYAHWESSKREVIKLQKWLEEHADVAANG